MDEQDQADDIRQHVRETGEDASDATDGRVDPEKMVDNADATLNRLSRSGTTRLWRRFDRGKVSRREFLKLLGLTAVGATAAVSLPRILRKEFPQAVTGRAADYNNTVNLADEGLSEGDDIMSYLGNIQSNTRYVVPDGSYTISSGTLSGSNYAVEADGCAQVTAPKNGGLNLRGDNFTLSGFLFRHSSNALNFQLNISGTDWTIANCAYEDMRGRDGYSIAPEVTTEGATGVFEQCYWPGVHDNADTGMVWINYDHIGDLLFRRCYLERGGIYGTSSADPMTRGRTNVEQCFFDSGNTHNIRTGNTQKTCHVKDTVITVDPEKVPTRSDGGFGPRCVWAWYGQVNVTNCDINQEASTAALVTHTKFGHSGSITMDGGNLKGSTAGDVTVRSNVGSSPSTSPPDGVPTTPDEACSGTASRGGRNASDSTGDDESTVDPC